MTPAPGALRAAALGALLALAVAFAAPASAGAGSTAFRFSPADSPASPRPFADPDWDVIVHSRDVATWPQPLPMLAEHGPDCSPPPATHPVQTYQDSVFVCRNHLMTAINGEGYGAIYLTPAHLLDFSAGPGTVRYQVSTERSSPRDWHDIWVSAFDDNLVLPLYFLPDLQGPPRNAVHIQLSSDDTFKATLFRDFKAFDLDRRDSTPYDRVLSPSANARTILELQLTRTRVRFGMPEHNLWWIDAAIPELPFNRGVVQFGHHSYNPTKAPGGRPGTWHWSGFEISPSVPFGLLHGSLPAVNADTPKRVCFAGSAPEGAHLRFAGVGDISVSFDGGRTFTAAAPAAQVGPHGEGSPQPALFASYWTPVPAGTTSVVVRGADWWGGPWWVRDPSIWSPSGTASSLPAPEACAGVAPAAATPAPAPPRAAAADPSGGDRDKWLLRLVPTMRHDVLFVILVAAAAGPIAVGLVIGLWAGRISRRGGR